MHNIYETKKSDKNCLDDNIGFNDSFHGYLDDRPGADVIFRKYGKDLASKAEN